MDTIKQMKLGTRRLERQIRKRLVAQIVANSAPHLYESGYMKMRSLDDDSRLKLVLLPHTYRLPELDDHGTGPLEVIAITESGIISDAFDGGAVSVGFNELAIESLEKLVKISAKLAATP